MFEALFEFLFKYRPLIFDQGAFALRASWFGFVAAAAAAAGAFLTFRTYLQVRGNSKPFDRAVLAGVRIAALAVLAFCLLRPVLVLSTVVPQENFLGVLIDDSRSMQIADSDEDAAARVRAAGAGDDGKYAAVRGSPTASSCGSSGSRRRPTGLRRWTRWSTPVRGRTSARRSSGAHDELSGVPLSGLVVVTDGADNADGGTRRGAAAAPGVRRAGVYRGAGAGGVRARHPDEPRRHAPPRAAGSLARGRPGRDPTAAIAGETVTVQIEDEGRIVATQDVELPADGEPETVRMRFTTAEAGPRLYSFSVAPQPGEMVTRNNVREGLIVVQDRRRKILYFEGEPRWEVKFLLRGVESDENLQVTLLQRTAENKFFRMNVDGPDELPGGFPTQRADLFAYSGLVLGSIEANHFTPDQLRMIADFVNRRGGGMLMLGSHRSFAEGGYAGTPVSDVLPVVLPPVAADSEEGFFAEVRVSATRAGASHAATQIADTEQASVERWDTLPPVTVVNPITEAKPGATVLLSAPDDLIILAFQRYGAGKSLALPIQDSWMWQMHADVPVEDQTHETFWRRLLAGSSMACRIRSPSRYRAIGWSRTRWSRYWPRWSTPASRSSTTAPSSRW